MINIGNRINLEDIKPNTPLTKAIAKVLELKDDSKVMLNSPITFDSKLEEKAIMVNTQENKTDLKSMKRKKKIILLKIILSSIVLDNTKYISNRQMSYKTYKKY